MTHSCTAGETGRQKRKTLGRGASAHRVEGLLAVRPHVRAVREVQPGRVGGRPRRVFGQDLVRFLRGFAPWGTKSGPEHMDNKRKRAAALASGGGVVSWRSSVVARAMMSIFPAPCSKMIGPFRRSAPSSSACFITAGFRTSHRFASGMTEARSTTAPATTGEATEVPERLRQPPGGGRGRAAGGREGQL